MTAIPNFEIRPRSFECGTCGEETRETTLDHVIDCPRCGETVPSNEARAEAVTA